MSKENIILDSGYDYNKDKHCDYDGWFVDKYGEHRPVIRRTKRDELISKSAFDYVSSDAFFNAYGEVAGMSLSPLYQYSLNDDNILLSSPNINMYLRNGYLLPNSMRKRIRELDYLINHFSIKNKLRVYRGIDLDVTKPYAKTILDLSRGDIYYDKGYTSTSHSMRVAFDYGQLHKGNIMVIMNIGLTEGIHAVPLFKENNSAGKLNESEILLQRNQKFVVTNRMEIKDGENIIIHLKMEALK